MILLALAFVTSAAVVAAATIPLRRFLALDIPNERSSHVTPTPRGGGIPIVVVVLAGFLVWLAHSGDVAGALPLLCAAAIVALVSWLDDVRSVPSPVRLAVHCGAAAVAIGTLGPITSIALPGSRELRLGSGAVPLTMFWIIGLTNAYNFMDGIDGIAGLQGLVAGLGWGLLSLHGEDDRGVVLGGLVGGSCLGFLMHNWSPASIFMGDVGSAFLGYVFAAMPLFVAGPEGTGRWSRARAATAAGMFVWPFIADTTMTLCLRLARRENVFRAHRSHLYQRLVQHGTPHAQVAALYGLLAAVGVIAALATV